MLSLSAGLVSPGKALGVLPLPNERDFSMQQYDHEENILLYRKVLAEYDGRRKAQGHFEIAG
jgi:hypothetical protein